MTTYAFRFGFIGFFQTPSHWINLSTNSVATLAPSLGDTILLNTPNGILSGDGSVDQITVGAPAGASAFTITGTVNAKQLTTTSAFALTAGAVLTLTGRTTTAPIATLGANTTLTAATLNAAGPIAITGALGAIQSSTISATSVTLGTGALSLDNSALNLAGGTDPSLVTNTTTGIAHISVANGASLSASNAIILAATGTADLIAATGAAITTPALTIGGTGTATLTLNAATLTTQNLVIAATTTARGTLTLTGGTILQLANGLQFTSAGTGSINLTGPGTLLDASNQPTIIGGPGQTALNIASGAQARLNTLTTPTATTITVDGANTRLDLSGPTFINPANGTTIITLTNAAALSASALTLANARLSLSNATATATAITGNSQSTLSLAGSSTLTTGTLNLAGTLSLTTGAALQATTASLTGPITLTSAATLQATTLTLASTPLTISGGASLTAPTITASSLITITGSGSRLTTSTLPAQVTLTQGATLALPTLTLASGTPNLDGSSSVLIGNAARPATPGYAVGQNATLSLNGTVLGATVTNAGTVIANNATLATATGPGTYVIAGGTLDIAQFSSNATFAAPFATLRIHALTAAASITNIRPGDTIDLPGLAATLTGGILSIGAYTLSLATAPGAALHLDTLPTGTRLTALDPLFDPAFYLAHNPDVAASGIDPYQHFMAYGWTEGRDPNALFSIAYYNATYRDAAGQNPLTDFEQSAPGSRNPDPYFNAAYYLAQNPDVAAAGLNPLAHYAANGWREGRNPSAQFSLAEYRAAYGPTQSDPLAAFLTNGRAAGRHAITTGPNPEPGFDSTYYYAHNPDVLAAGINAFQHWRTNGLAEGRMPDAYFDPKYYLAQNPSLPPGTDPLADYLNNGANAGCDPSLLFSTSKYLGQNADVAAAHINALLHYLSNGQVEGRMAFLAGPNAPADPMLQTAFYDRQLGATLIPTGLAADQQAAASYDTYGWQHALNPNAYFDTAYYLAHNPDVAAAHLNPLLHYESNGWHEGRNPSAAFSTRAYLAANPDVAAANLNPLQHYLTNGQAEGRLAIPV